MKLDPGLSAFLPRSRAVLPAAGRWEAIIGWEGEFEVITNDPARGDVAVAMVVPPARPPVPGEVLEGRVKRVVGYGVFVSLGPVDGLLHVSKIPGGVRDGLDALFTEGDALTVEVLRVDGNRVELGLPPS